jgi:hypothetical protein
VHIPVENEDDAKAVLELIKSGGDFAALAKEKSNDPGGAAGALIGRSSVPFPIENSELLSRPCVQTRVHLIFHVTDPLGSARGLKR